MAAADLFVGKAGGLSSSEALARGLVLVIVNPIPGQEERNADHYLEEGVAIRCNNLATLSWKISSLLEDAPRLDGCASASVAWPGPTRSDREHRLVARRPGPGT